MDVLDRKIEGCSPIMSQRAMQCNEVLSMSSFGTSMCYSHETAYRAKLSLM